ncbi:MAG TPA: T9SS type A sorting domain-containing protein, partial [Flavipsychrobacter sp.]|nr:T9SS type A sorting domain-containing protein [Flavipsychrobacter sp.]
MKKTIFTLGCALLSVSSFAQIVINAANAHSSTSLVGSDRVANVVVGTSSFPLFIPATGGSWDMTNVSYSGVDTLVRNSPAFPYQFADSISYQAGLFHYSLDRQYYFIIQGIQGEADVVNTQVYVMPGGVISDSIYFGNQTEKYSTPYYKLPFPLAYGNNWNSNYSDTTNFFIKDTALGYKKTAGSKITTVSESDKVIGYGNMKVKIFDNGDTSTPYPVLQLRTTRITNDSFTINGAPFTSALDSIFNLPQTSTVADTIHSESFYRIGELTPLAYIVFTDNTFSTVQSAQIHADRLSLFPLAISNIASSDFDIYPNPVTAHTIKIDMPNSNNEEWHYEVINVSGQVLVSNTITFTGSHAQITLPAAIAP